MNSLHLLFELFSCILCFLIAREICIRLKKVLSTFNFLFFIGFVVVGFMDAIHGIAGYLNNGLMESWVPLTWGTSRFILVATLFAGCFQSKKQLSLGARGVSTMLALSIAVSFIAIALPYCLVDIDWVYSSDSIIKRPIDGVLCVAWIFVTGLLYKVESATMQLPETILPFLILGVSVHAVMAFGSTQSLDSNFMIAHLLKLVEYCLWFYAIKEENISGHFLARSKEINLVLKEYNDEFDKIDSLIGRTK